MPQKQYTVQAPDGRTVTLEGPEGASEQEVIAQAQRLMGSSPKTLATPEPQPTLDQRLHSGIRNVAGIVGTPLSMFTPGYNVGETSVDAVTGALRGVGSTAFGLRSVMEKVLGRTPSPKPDFLTPQNTAEKVGFGAEQIGEFMLPGMAGAKPASLMGRSLRAAAEAGAVATAQTGGNEQAAITAAVTAGVIPLAIPGINRAASFMGEKIQKVSLGATKTDFDNGFKYENIAKYGVGGSPYEIASKSGEKIVKAAEELKVELKNPGNGIVDFLQIMQETQDELMKNAALKWGSNKQIQNAFNEIFDDAVNYIPAIAKTGRADLADAQQMKRGIGLLGSWLKGSRDEGAGAKATVANVAYSKIRAAIEAAAQNGGKRVKELNKIMGDLIPIEQAALRRVPVDDRKAIASLSDILILAGSVKMPAQLGLFLINKASKSGKVGNALVTGSGKVTGNVAAPALGGATGLMTSRDRK